MKKVEKLIVTPKWLEIKEIFEKESNGSNKFNTNIKIGSELDKLCFELTQLLSELTLEYGYNCNVEGIPLDLWKERIWVLTEKAGLLPDVAWRTDKESDKEIQDDWYNIENDWDYQIEELEVKVFGE